MTRTRSGLNPGSMLVTYRQLRTSKPAPTSRTIASANSVTTSARRILRVAAPPETLLPLSSPEGRKSRRNAVIAGASPTRIPVRRETARAQPRTRGSRLSHSDAAGWRGRRHGRGECLLRRACANQSRDPGQQDAFGEQLPHDPSGTRAERSTNGHLAGAGDAAREREACDVGRGDQKHEHTAPSSIHNANRDWGPTR